MPVSQQRDNDSAHHRVLTDDRLRDLIVTRGPQEEMEAAAATAGFQGLLNDGLLKAVEGMTTYEEVRGIK